MELNAHFLDTALASGERLIECPITFHLQWASSGEAMPVIFALYGLDSE